MEDTLDIVKNIENIYNSNTAFSVLKDFERVLDELDLYVYKNWEDGELAKGPDITRHWVTCSFIWEAEDMPDPAGGKRLLDYDCKVKYKKSHKIVPRKIKDPDDYRPGTKKGKLDRIPVWLVEITMPKSLLADMYGGYKAEQGSDTSVMQQPQPADEIAAEAAPEVAPEEGVTV